MNIYHIFSAIMDTLIVTIFMGWGGGAMIYENTLMLYQQDLQLVPYFVKWQMAID